MSARRPRSLSEMGKRLGLLFDPKQIEESLQLTLRPTDVVITPFAKSGTTWTQQIVHQLRTGGDMDFDDISRVVPWIEMGRLLEIDLDAEQRANPRAFKSHMGWDRVPKGGRYINVVRNPGDALVSAFRFQEGWFFEPGSVDLETFARSGFFKSRNYYAHLRSWWPRRADPDVLFLAFESMLAHPEDSIRRIAKFIGVPLTASLLETTLEASTADFMRAHKDRFDDAMMRAASEEIAGLPPGSDSSKIRDGKTGARAELSAPLQAELERLWHEEIEVPLGIASYEDLVSALAEQVSDER